MTDNEDFVGALTREMEQENDDIRAQLAQEQSEQYAEYVRQGHEEDVARWSDDNTIDKDGDSIRL